MRLVEAVSQVEARLDERQRGILLPLAQQDESTYVEQVGYQEFVPGGPGNRQRLVAVLLGDQIVAGLL